MPQTVSETAIVGRTPRNASGRKLTHGVRMVLLATTAIMGTLGTGLVAVGLSSITTTMAGAASTAATLSQCTNGAVGPPLVIEQCAGASGGGSVSILNGQSASKGYANWVSGNSNGSKSHWREGDFISYRAQVTAPTGDHTIV